MENIGIYYESTKQVYNQIIDWVMEQENPPVPFRKKITHLLIGISVVIFMLSLIPILPSILVFAGSHLDWEIRSFSLNQSTIWTYALAWLLSTIFTFIMMLLTIWLDRIINLVTKQKKGKAPQTLSSEQLTFIFAYEAYKELKIFFVSNFDQHVEKALSSLWEMQSPYNQIFEGSFGKRLPGRDIKRLNYHQGEGLRLTSPYLGLSGQISVAREFLQTFEKFPWFHIDDVTKARLQAIITFQEKIGIRLEKREDLPAVLSILENLSKFFYAFLPEHQANLESTDIEALQIEGTKCLDKFVQDVNKLIDYPYQKQSLESEHPAPKESAFQKVQSFYFNNVFFRFTIWLISLLVITSSLVLLVSYFIHKLDINIMVSTIIIASVTGAAALSVFRAKSIKTEQVSKKDKDLDKHQDITEIVSEI